MDVLFDPFGARWSEVRDAALATADAGLDGVWVYDHLAGSVHGAPHVLECWTVLAAIAARVPTIALGSLVLNVANRAPGLVAVMAATLQEVSGGRLLLGLGAGAGRGTPYAAEQVALGRDVAGDASRRRDVEAAVATIRAAWTGRMGGASGFLRPDPAPPIVLGGFGPKMAALAGSAADGVNLPGGPHLGDLLSVARRARDASSRAGHPFLVTASAPPSPRQLQALRELGVDRAIVYAAPPYLDDIGRLAALVRS